MGGRGGMRSWMDGKIEGGKVGRLLGLMDGRMGGYGRKKGCNNYKWKRLNFPLFHPFIIPILEVCKKLLSDQFPTGQKHNSHCKTTKPPHQQTQKVDYLILLEITALELMGQNKSKFFNGVNRYRGLTKGNS